MKTLALILSFYLLFLAIEPGLKVMSTNKGQETLCCNGNSCQPFEKKQPQKQSEKKDCNDNSACNPFQICKTCTAFTGELALQTFTPIILFAKPQADNKEKVPPQITIDFWQPPKIA